MIISLGLLVDDAIIAIEIMVVKLEEGADRLAAASYAWSHTAAPMLAGTMVTVAGFLPVGFARSTAGEYAGNIFWIVAFALMTSWIVAVVFTPYLGVKMLPEIKRVEGGAHGQIYQSRAYNRLRGIVGWSVRHKYVVAGTVVLLFAVSVPGLGMLKQQFFPNSDRTEVLVEVQMTEGTSIEATSKVGGPGRGLVEVAARGQDRQHLRRGWGPAVLPRLQPRTARPVIRQDDCRHAGRCRA